MTSATVRDRMSRVVALRVAAAAILLVGLAGAPVAATGDATAVGAAPRPGQVGRWLVDGAGRVLLMHGVNMVYKRAPYAPDEIGFGRDDAAFLARHGFTTVRLGLIWRAVEPRPGQYDDAYLARVRRIVQILARHGVTTMLDFHQDLYHERFQGEGAPTWAVRDDGLPAQPRLGFPSNYFGMVALWRAFDHFWANTPGPGGVGLQDRYGAAWRHVAEFFADTRGVMGFDLMNEPFPGSDYATCLQPAGCPHVDTRITAFSQRAIDAIRRSDRRTVVFYEPHLFFNVGVPTYVAPKGRRLGFSFHDYCGTHFVHGGYEGCDQFDTMVFDNADAQAARLHDVPLLTEFGATTDQTTLRAVVDRAMRHRTGWQFWAYCGCDDPTTTGPGETQALVYDPARPPTGANVDWAKLQALAVPHPTRVAGTPLRYRFDRDTRTFRLLYSTLRAAGLPGRFRAGSRTTAAVPRLQYPTGYRARVDGAQVLSQPNAQVLRLALLPGASKVRLTLLPR
jgi:endoglycosylceramidase